MSTKKIIIIDYGVGNVRSVGNALAWLGYAFSISRNKRDIHDGSSLILPGVGAFAEGMKNLKKFDLINILKEEVCEKKKPCLGICLGAQLMLDSGEEGGHHQGLGWIKGRVVKFLESKTPRIPHVGWNTLTITKRAPLFERTGERANYYFDHSYYFKGLKKNVLATCQYGVEFTAAVGKDNIYGVQFHPEKSQVNGLKLFRSFFKSFSRP